MDILQDKRAGKTDTSTNTRNSHNPQPTTHIHPHANKSSQSPETEKLKTRQDSNPKPTTARQYETKTRDKNQTKPIHFPVPRLWNRGTLKIQVVMNSLFSHLLSVVSLRNIIPKSGPPKRIHSFFFEHITRLILYRSCRS